MVRSAATVAALAVGSISLVGLGSPAYAATTCGSPVSKQLVAHMDFNYSFNVSQVQYCPIWKSNTPVYNNPYNSRQLVGNLVYAGSSNWFVCRSSSHTDPYSAHGYSTRDWAITMADNGRWGWVPAVYFGGSENYWAGLRQCTTYEYP
jgi:hypothetical protein